MSRRTRDAEQGKRKGGNVNTERIEAPPADNLQTRADAPERRWRRRFTVAAAVVAAGVIPFILLEFGLRSFRYGYPTGFFVPIAGKNAFSSNERFGWRFFPASIARTPVVSYLPAAKSTETYRIFILGDSAAMGIPEPAFSFGRMLRVMLQSRYPGIRFEVINAAMTAINSYAMVSIADDSAGQKPDLFIVLGGNNEVVGPYGPGTVLAQYSSSLWLIRAGIWFKSTRTAELMEYELARFRKPPEQQEWRGMAMFAGHDVGFDDSRLGSVYENFRANLVEICRIARRAKAGTILSTVPVNLRDSPPFASIHRSDLSGDEKARWQRMYDDAVEKSKAGDCSAGISGFNEAAQLDDRFAELHFRLAQCLLALNRPVEARKHFLQARDLDALRFRADSRINQTIREVTTSQGGNIQFADTERAFAEASGPSSAPGGELFYEHVHMNFAGNYLAARTILPRIEARLPERIRSHVREDRAMSEDDVAKALTFTEWDRDRSTMEMLGMMEDPPFTAQADHAEKQARIESTLAALNAKWSSREKFDAMGQHFSAYAEALRRDPDDLELREILSELLSKSGDYAGAIAQYRSMIDLVPGIARWHANLARELAEAGRLDEARTEAEHALHLDPQFVAAHFTLGLISERSGNRDEALVQYGGSLRNQRGDAETYHRMAMVLTQLGKYREAADRYSQFLRLSPESAEGESNLGFLLVKTGDIRAALPHYREALRLRPGFPEAANNLGAALERLGEKAEAISYYRMALGLRPDFPEARRHLNDALAEQNRLK